MCSELSSFLCDWGSGEGERRDRSQWPQAHTFSLISLLVTTTIVPPWGNGGVTTHTPSWWNNQNIISTLSNKLLLKFNFPQTRYNLYTHRKNQQVATKIQFPTNSLQSIVWKMTNANLTHLIRCSKSLLEWDYCLYTIEQCPLFMRVC